MNGLRALITGKIVCIVHCCSAVDGEISFLSAANFPIFLLQKWQHLLRDTCAAIRENDQQWPLCAVRFF